MNETRELHRSFYDRNSQIFSGNRLPENQVDSSTYCLAHGMRSAPHNLSVSTIHCIALLGGVFFELSMRKPPLSYRCRVYVDIHFVVVATQGSDAWRRESVRS